MAASSISRWSLVPIQLERKGHSPAIMQEIVERFDRTVATSAPSSSRKDLQCRLSVAQRGAHRPQDRGANTETADGPETEA
jgi:hypothetical protein